MRTVKKADILIPKNADMKKWSVIACDQFTSEPEYWKSVEKFAGEEPSTCKLALPEAYLGREEEKGAPARINATMEEYLQKGTFTELKQSFVFVERQMQNGKIRHGVVGAIDLENYDWRPEVRTDVKATERTVEERLYKRLEVRESCCIELPHVIVFYEDETNALTNELTEYIKDKTPLYDFNLMKDGGRIKGYTISGEKAAFAEQFFESMENSKRQSSKISYAVGDGNHSLATAKLSWEKIKQDLSPEEEQTHPARFALVELVNVYDEGIEILPIHRVIKSVDSKAFIYYFKANAEEKSEGCSEYILKSGSGESSEEIIMKANSVGDVVAMTDSIIGSYISEKGGDVDYVHNDESAIEIGGKENSAYILLPAIEKSEIFSTVSQNRILPKKSFSIGHAQEKRYYLEARKIK